MIGQWKGKVRMVVLESRGREDSEDRGQQREMRRNEDGTESHGPEKPQVTGDLIAGE